MNAFKLATLNCFKVTGDYRKDLLKILYTDALDGHLFAKMHVLIGLGTFEECFETEEEELDHYDEFVKEFEKATGKRFLGAWQGEPEASAADHAPDAALSTEAYREELMQVLLDAQSGCNEADDWDLYYPGEKADELHLTYAEILAYNAGINAWTKWLAEKLAIEDSNEAEEFMATAEAFFTEEFFKLAEELRAVNKDEE